MVEIVHTQVFTAVGPARDRMLSDHPGQYDTPWWGTKDTLHIKNLGFVIGFRDDARHQRYRLDYDPLKGLHINWVQEIPASATTHAATLKECYRIKPFIIAGEDEMYTFFRTWTMHYCGDCPQEIRDKIGPGKIWRGAFWA